MALAVSSTTRLRGRWLVGARVAWTMTTALTIGLYVAALPARFADLQTVCAGTTCGDTLAPEGFHQLEALGLAGSSYAVIHLTVDVALVLTFLAVAVLIAVRRSDDWLALLGSLTLVTFGSATFPSVIPLLVARSPAWWLPVTSVIFLGSVTITTFFYLFPDGRFVPGWTRWLAGAWVALEAVRFFWPLSTFNYTTWSPPVAALIFLTAPGGIVLAQIYRYRRVSNPVQRQQTKWAVFGAAVAVGGFVGLTLLIEVTPGVAGNALLASAGRAIAFGFMQVLPLSIGFSILRYHLWDIDVLVNRALVYGALTGALGLVYVGSVASFQGLFHGLTGQSTDLAIVGSTLAIAALFQPLRRRIQGAIDRRFYRRKYDAAQVLAAFGATLRDEVELGALTRELLAVVEETMQPRSMSVWLRDSARKGRVRDA